MYYCINPQCRNRENEEDISTCQTCGTTLLIHNRYRLIKPLRLLTSQNYTDIFEVLDGETRKVMKVLKVDSPQLVTMFKREAFTLCSLNHPGIPKVEPDDYFTFTPHNSSQELHCLVMQKMEGMNLEEWLLEHGSISQSIALKWLRQILEILEIIHQHHFFHRDIKPSNIILQPNGQLALIDFGAVRDISNTYLGKIVTGETVGSITTIMSGGYTPPEQIDGKALPQSDFYALGRTFVHLLTGKSPVELPTNPKTGKLIWHKQASGISKLLVDFIDELMAYLPADRPQNTSAIIKYLNPQGLLIKSILRFLVSPKFKFTLSAFILVIVNSFLIEFGSRPWRASDANEEGRKALVDNRLGDNERLDIARNKFEKAVELNPIEAKYYNDLGLICKVRKEYDCAIDNYQKSLKFAKEIYKKATTHYNIGVLYEETSKFREAIYEYQKTIDLQKEYQEEKVDIFIGAVNNLARLQIWQNRNNKLAIELISPYLEKDTALIPLQIKASLYKNLGWAYLQLGQLGTAEKYLKIAITKNEKKNRAAPYCLLAKIKLLQKINSNDTLQTWQKCRDYNGKNLPEVKTWQLDAVQYLNSKGKSQ